MKGYPDYTISFKRDKKKIFGIYHEICTLHCRNCGCTIQQAGATREKAEENVLKAWNRRTEPHWIPCSERLPELGKDVLATLFHANGELGIVMVKRTTSFNPGDTYWEDWANEYSWENENVLAWMPLPDCYKGE